jgi:hypothetical protein
LPLLLMPALLWSPSALLLLLLALLLLLLLLGADRRTGRCALSRPTLTVTVPPNDFCRHAMPPPEPPSAAAAAAC